MKVFLLYMLLAINFLLTINSAAAQTFGCTDPLAINYNTSATINDGSCLYEAVSVFPSLSFNLADNLSETSGLIRWNDQIWTHNDGEDINLYALDTVDGSIVNSYPLTGTLNTGWEEISQDNEYIYVGDFGNNQNGNRTDLKILRVTKNSILTGPPEIDTISFSYSDQQDFTPTGPNNTDFDCEAFIVSTDSIYLFTKQWLSNGTNLYSIPKSPGIYSAKRESTYNVEGLVTGAVYLESKKLVALCGYSRILEPFVFLLYDFKGSTYFSGNKRKILVSLPAHQVEGIATINGLKYYISNEYFTQPPFVTTLQKIHILDLNSYLKNYLESLPTAISKTEKVDNYTIYPVPAGDYILVNRGDNLNEEDFSFINYTGQSILTGKLTEEVNRIDISSLSCGMYFLRIGERGNQLFKVIKK